MRQWAWPLVHSIGLALALASFADEATRHAVHLEVRDGLTGSDLAASVRREVEAGTAALEFMEDVVAFEYRRYPGVGVFVTGLCGVTAPRGTFWALSVNGRRAEKGISDLRIEEPVRIRWDLVEMDAERPEEKDQ